ncbi:MAG TPA: aquaporin [Pirellulales bacterium]|nr:aquaporin [Pirellulales bacterium]
MDAKATLAELIGTFTLVFIGAGAGALAEVSGGGIVGVALAHGLALMVIVYAWGSVSGAHVNPAVTLGVAVAGRMDWGKAIAYWIAQFVGAAVAAYLLAWLLASNANLGATIGSLTPHGVTPGEPLKVVVLEAILTFFLVVAVFASGIHGRNGNMAGIAIGLVLTMDIFCGGALTGASMNPARTFGPALAMNDLGYLWMYIVGPAIGGVVAALLYDKFFLPTELKPPVEAAESRGSSRS